MQAKDIPDRDVLAACEQAHARGGSAAHLLATAGYPAKVVRVKLERLARRGLIASGVSIETAWLTDQGTSTLATLRGEADRRRA